MQLDPETTHGGPVTLSVIVVPFVLVRDWFVSVLVEKGLRGCGLIGVCQEFSDLETGFDSEGSRVRRRIPLALRVGYSVPKDILGG